MPVFVRQVKWTARLFTHCSSTHAWVSQKTERGLRFSPRSFFRSGLEANTNLKVFET